MIFRRILILCFFVSPVYSGELAINISSSQITPTNIYESGICLLLANYDSPEIFAEILVPAEYQGKLLDNFDISVFGDLGESVSFTIPPRLMGDRYQMYLNSSFGDNALDDISVKMIFKGEDGAHVISLELGRFVSAFSDFSKVSKDEPYTINCRPIDIASSKLKG